LVAPVSLPSHAGGRRKSRSNMSQRVVVIMELSVLEQVRRAFGTREEPGLMPISRSQVMAWMESDELDVLSTLYHYLTEEPFSQFVAPALNAEDNLRFAKKYLERCIIEGPSSEFADNRYEAAHEAARWFRYFWKGSGNGSQEIHGLKSWLETMYLQGDDSVRICVVNGVLEHLFEDVGIQEFFADWSLNADLQDAFARAKQWADGTRGKLGVPGT